MTPKASGRSFWLGLAVGVLLSVAVATVVGLGSDLDLSSEESATDQAMDVILEDYWQQTDRADLQNGSIEGMVDHLRREFRDRFSHYFDPETFAEFQNASQGQFSGIGLGVNEVPRGLRVGQVYEDSPAEEAGIEEGDVITAVEGESIAGEPAEASTAKIKGPPGTEVTITVESDGERRDITVERADVRIPAVAGELRRSGGTPIGYIQVFTFSNGLHADLRAEVERLVRRGAEGIVLDLRGNGGGLLNEAVLSASIFIEDGTIVSTEGRTQPKEVYEAVGDALPERPMAVLIDGDTASASEILASALEDYDLATLVGTRTYGKGTFQEVIELDDGSGLNLTIGEYFTSDGTSLAGRGIPAQVRASDREGTERDEALERALAIVAAETP